MALSDGKKLRRELAAVVGRRGPCFPRELKERAARWLTEQRREGAKVADLAAELGLCEGTVLRWSAAAATKGPRTRALVPVVVVPDRTTVHTLSVISPSGFRIDGLSYDEAVLLLRALT